MWLQMLSNEEVIQGASTASAQQTLHASFLCLCIVGEIIKGVSYIYIYVCLINWEELIKCFFLFYLIKNIIWLCEC